MRMFLLAGMASLLMSCADAPVIGPITMMLEGSEWGTEIEGQYIQFMQGGETAGNGGCNQFSGAYYQSGGDLEIAPLISTKMACAQMEQENLLFAVLEDTRSADISHLVLVLKDADGKTLLTLKRRDWD